MDKLKEIEESIGGYDLSHLNDSRLRRFEKKLKILSTNNLSIEEEWKIKLDLACEVLCNSKNKN